MGWVARVRKASICSVTRMVPSSAANAAPTRPATIKAVSTGPSSLHIETLTTASVAVSMRTLWNWK